MRIRTPLAILAAFLLQVPIAAVSPASAQRTPGPPAAAAAEEGGEEEKEPIVLLSRAAKDDKFFKFDYGIPTSPALTLAGLSPDKTTTSSSLKDFVVSLPTFINSEDGGQAIALDFAPASLAGGNLDDSTFTEYVRGNTGWRGIANRTRVGVALFQGNESAADPTKAIPSKLAVGVSFSLLNASDPLLTPSEGDSKKGYLLTCLEAQSPRAYAILERDIQASANLPNFKETYPGLSDEERTKLKTIDTRGEAISEEKEDQTQILADDSSTPAQKTAAQEKLDKLSAEEKQLAEIKQKALDLMVERDDNGVLGKEIKACALEASLRAETAMDLDIGLGALWRGAPGELEDFEESGAAAWIAFRMPFTRKFELGKDLKPTLVEAWLLSMSGRFSADEFLATKNAATPEFQADVSEAWLGIERMSPNLRFSAHYGYRDIRANEAAGQPFESSSDRYLVAAKVRLGKEDDGLWLNLSYGNANGATADKDDHTALITLSFSPTD
jgi:hypothetical protein